MLQKKDLRSSESSAQKLDSTDDAALDFEVVVEQELQQQQQHKSSIDVNHDGNGDKKKKNPTNATRTKYQLIRIVKHSNSMNGENNNEQQLRQKVVQVQTWINDAATMMLDHWPNGGPMQNYIAKIMSSSSVQPEVASSPMSSANNTSNNVEANEHNEHETKSHHHHTLPCSYLLLESNNSSNDSDSSDICCCIGHARLTQCFQGAGGHAAAAT